MTRKIIFFVGPDRSHTHTHPKPTRFIVYCRRRRWRRLEQEISAHKNYIRNTRCSRRDEKKKHTILSSVVVMIIIICRVYVCVESQKRTDICAITIIPARCEIFFLLLFFRTSSHDNSGTHIIYTRSNSVYTSTHHHAHHI